ncbi:hypothetical protein PPM_4500 [Paenibacillus polymyxa M1]|uniref:DUF2304 domain-containing protein n=1 Tax=Paenibacillus polymyxa TaxID=1406 RepID=UPI0002661264|nr:DUF2304 domain-containing protein [Paenibacillus polymyxa]OAZ50985.1 hypothetical protein A9Z39_01480 [Paenibacillus polymyxa]CCI71307.1 hypothetical protein PPM_4500 [Paenibacillus polymyxa M1]
MISIKLQFILIAGALICFLVLLNLLRKYRMELKYSMLWIIAMIVVLILSFFPSLFNYVSRIMGIEVPVNALFLLAIFGIFVIMFSLTIEVSKSTIKIKELSQELGLVKHELNKIREIEREN